MIDIDKVVDNAEEELYMLRRYFHQHPEAAWLEYSTAVEIIRFLQECGITVKYGRQVIKEESRMGLPSDEEIEEAYEMALSQDLDKDLLDEVKGGFTGVVGILESQKPGPTVALRFDMDAVLGSESNSTEHRPVREGFNSINSKAVHSCGHDGHIAIGLVLAKCIKKLYDAEYLSGRVILVFQPAEEGVRGAKAMIDAGVLDNADYLLSGHIGFKSTKTGEIICGTEGFLHTKKIDISLKGVAAHAGSSPHKGRNALLAAAATALGAHTLGQHGEGIARINVGVLNSGTARNLVPEEAEIKVEVRGQYESIVRDLSDRLEEVVKGSSKMFGVDYKIDVAGEAGEGTSDPELIELIGKAAADIKEVNRIVEKAELGGSEDVTLMMKKVQSNGGKACYIMFGSNLAAGHHQSNFDFDERVLPIAVKLYLQILRKLSVLTV